MDSIKQLVLIVDDEGIYREGILVPLVTQAGFDYVSVNNPIDAFKELDSRQFNVLLLDTIGKRECVVGPSIAKYAIDKGKKPRIIALSGDYNNKIHWEKSGVPYEFFNKDATYNASFIDVLKGTKNKED